MQQPLAARRQAQPTGVIETLSAGYSAVNHHLWVLLLPILLDVFLWFGPHVSYSPLVGPVVTQAAEWTRQVALSLAGEMDRARVELLSGAIAEVRRRARRYVQEPSDTAWHDLVDGLTRTYGDMETYLLRAVEIHSRTTGGAEPA